MFMYVSVVGAKAKLSPNNIYTYIFNIMVNSCFGGVSCVCVLISRRHEFGLTRVFRFRLTRRGPAAFGNGNNEGKKTIPEVIRKRLFCTGSAGGRCR